VDCVLDGIGEPIGEAKLRRSILLPALLALVNAVPASYPPSAAEADRPHMSVVEVVVDIDGVPTAVHVTTPNPELTRLRARRKTNPVPKSAMLVGPCAEMPGPFVPVDVKLTGMDLDALVYADHPNPGL